VTVQLVVVTPLMVPESTEPLGVRKSAEVHAAYWPEVEAEASVPSRTER
jgi:hypothetical protein